MINSFRNPSFRSQLLWTLYPNYFKMKKEKKTKNIWSNILDKIHILVMSPGFHSVLDYYIPPLKNMEYSTRHVFNSKLHHLGLLKAMGQPWVTPLIFIFVYLMKLPLCTAALLPELKPAPCFLSAIIGQID